MIRTSTGTLYSSGGNGALYRSTDDGRSWVSMHNGVISHGGGWDVKFRGRVGVNARGILGLATTTDDGDRWRYSRHDDAFFVAAVAPDSSIVALGMKWNLQTNREDYGLYRLNHGDTTVRRVENVQLPARADSATALIATDDGALFAIWNGDPYRSIDRGRSWSNVSAGLPEAVQTFTVTYDGALLATVDGYGVYRWIGGSADVPDGGRNSATVAVSGLAVSHRSNEALISLVLDAPAVVSIHVVDIQGQRVMSLLNEQFLAAGKQSLRHSLLGLPSGGYFVVLSAGSERVVRRLLVVR